VNNIKRNAVDSEIKVQIRQILASGDTRQWGEVFEKYKKPVFAICLRMLENEEDARDITSDAFIRAFENIRKYDLDRPFFPWLCRVAANLCIDYIRKKQRLQFTQVEDWSNIRNEEDSAPDRKSGQEALMNRAIEKLKGPQKLCFCLFYIHDKSYDDITRFTGYSYNEVRSHIQNGRRKFKLEMEKTA
jgi:RNA polymerase sigma-70 factor (ECF subfamily)